MFSGLLGAIALGDGINRGDGAEAVFGALAMTGDSNLTSAAATGLAVDGAIHGNLGEIALAAGIAATNTNNSRTYSSGSYSPPSHYYHHHESPAYQALLLEEQRAEERRIALEERHRREQKARRDAANQEIQDQANRHEIHLKHYQLITLAKTSNYDDLKAEIQNTPSLPSERPNYRYTESITMGFPEIKSENIFSAILGNHRFTSDNKIHLLNKLHMKGYHKHDAYLVKNPALTLLLEEKSPAMASKLISAYNSYLNQSKGENLNRERDIWKKIRDTHHPGQILEVLRNVIRHSVNYQKPMQFVIDWINDIHSPTDILAAHSEIDKIFKAFRHINLSDHTDDIFKFAKQRILAIEKHSESKEGAPSVSHLDKGRVELFLNHHRGWHLCFQRTKSKEIYDELRNNARRAKQLFDEENVKIENTLTKLHLYMR